MIKVKFGRCHAVTGVAAAVCISAWTVAAICKAEETGDGSDELEAKPQATAPKLPPPEGETQVVAQVRRLA